MTLEKDMTELGKAFDNLKAQTIYKFIGWFWKLKYAKFIYILLGAISCAYIIGSFYMTFDR